MLYDAFKFLVDTGEARRPTAVPIENTNHYLVTKGDSIEFVDKPPQNTVFRVDTIAGLIESDIELVHIGRDELCIHVYAYGDSANGDDYVYATFGFDAPFEALDTDILKVSQRKFVTLLKTVFAPCPEAAELARKFSRLDFETIQRSKSEQTSKKSSLGKSVDKQADGLDEIPDVLKLTVPVTVLGYTHTIRIGWAINFTDEDLELCPFKADLHNAVTLQKAAIANEIESQRHITVLI